MSNTFVAAAVTRECVKLGVGGSLSTPTPTVLPPQFPQEKQTHSRNRQDQYMGVALNDCSHNGENLRGPALQSEPRERGSVLKPFKDNPHVCSSL